MKKRDTYYKYLLINFINKFKNKKTFHEKNLLDLQKRVSYGKVALIIDNQVQDIIFCEERLFSILISSPDIVDISTIKVSVGEYWDRESNQFFEDIK